MAQTGVPQVRGRYAPSPTGFLHLGNARTALLAYAQAQGGTLTLRVEDLDTARSRPEYIAANLEELRWLGLSWDEGPDVGGPHGPYLQSERGARYAAALEHFRPQLYECFLSRKDVQELASAPHGATPRYGPLERAANVRLTPQKRVEGKTPSLRFRVDDPDVAFTDLLRGPQRQTVGDIVLRRADGEWAYQLAVVVDDLAMRISHVLRGDDLLQSTGAQLLLYRALGATPPVFMHVPLLLGEDGKRLAKRQGSLTITALREAGVRPERVLGLLAYSLGLVEGLLELSFAEFVARCHLECLPPTPFRLESQHLEWLHR